MCASRSFGPTAPYLTIYPWVVGPKDLLMHVHGPHVCAHRSKGPRHMHTWSMCTCMRSPLVIYPWVPHVHVKAPKANWVAQWGWMDQGPYMCVVGPKDLTTHIREAKGHWAHQLPMGHPKRPQESQRDSCQHARGANATQRVALGAFAVWGLLGLKCMLGGEGSPYMPLRT